MYIGCCSAGDAAAIEERFRRRRAQQPRVGSAADCRLGRRRRRRPRHRRRYTARHDDSLTTVTPLFFLICNDRFYCILRLILLYITFDGFLPLCYFMKVIAMSRYFHLTVYYRIIRTSTIHHFRFKLHTCRIMFLYQKNTVRLESIQFQVDLVDISPWISINSIFDFRLYKRVV